MKTLVAILAVVTTTVALVGFGFIGAAFVGGLWAASIGLAASDN